MSQALLNWDDISDQLQEQTHPTEGLKKQIQEIIHRENKERIKKDTADLKKILQVKENRFFPNYEQMFQRKGAPGSGRGRGVTRLPHIQPPLTCSPNYSFIAEQKSDYFYGFNEDSVEKFANNNKPSAANPVINFENKSSTHINKTNGEISLASITGYGSKTDGVIFPGQGNILTAGITQIFYPPENNFGVIQATARIAGPFVTVFLDPGPVDSNVEGMVAVVGIATVLLFVYNPQTGHYVTQSNRTTFYTYIAKGAKESYYSSKFLGTPYGTTFAFSNFLSSNGQTQPIDISVNIRYEPSSKPVYVQVIIDMYSILMVGNEKVSGIVINCQNTNEATPVMTFTDQRTVLTGSPFKVEAIRLCGI